MIHDNNDDDRDENKDMQLPPENIHFNIKSINYLFEYIIFPQNCSCK